MYAIRSYYAKIVAWSGPTASKSALATVVLPEPDPPAIPIRKAIVTDPHHPFVQPVPSFFGYHLEKAFGHW